MRYRGEDLANIVEDFQLITAAHGECISALDTWVQENPLFKEVARFACMRQLGLLTHTTRRVFEIFWPNELVNGTEEIHQDLAAFIGRHYVSAVASLDGLAALWVLHHDIRKATGEQLPRTAVSLFCDGRKSSRPIWESYPPDIQMMLGDDYADWGKMTARLRNSIAHRVPGYVPREVSSENDAARIQELERARWDELLREREDGEEMNHDKIDQLYAEEEALYRVSHFYMTDPHKDVSILYHGQMVVNCKTVFWIYAKFLPLMGYKGRIDPYFPSEHRPF